MLFTTPNNIEGKTITCYYSIISKKVIIGANAIIAIDLDYETIGNMLMVTASGTAVKFE